MLEVISSDYDARIKSYCVTIKSDYAWYLGATEGAETNLSIQRDIIRDKKAYQTLRNDLKRGCVLPPTVLALNLPDFDAASFYQRTHDHADPTGMGEALAKSLIAIEPAQVQIIDGLQRTNAIRQTRDELEGEERSGFLQREIRVEAWLNIKFFALAYRMILLNAGQRPMAIKHQIEIISNQMAEELDGIEGLEVIKTIEHRRRFHPGQFQLVKLTQAFQAWLQGQPNVDLRNVIAEQLLADEAVDTLGESLAQSEGNNQFKDFIAWLVRMDRLLGAEHLGFFAQETVLQGISAAVGKALRNPRLSSRLKEALALLEERANVEGAARALAVIEFDELRRGIDVQKRNVGEATRDLAFKGFGEFIRSPDTSMSEHWTFAASS